MSVALVSSWVSVSLSPLSAVLVVLLLLTSAVASYLPFVLTPADAISRRAILLLSTLLCAEAGVLLSSALFYYLTAALSSASALSLPPFVPLLCFLLGLLSCPAVERCLLQLGGWYVRRLRAIEAASEEEEQQHARLNGQTHRGRAELDAASNPLLPPPVRDYRQKRALDDVSDDDDFDYDDRRAISPSPPPGLSSYAYYTSYQHMPALDAAALLSERYQARCIFCKDDIATRKAAAYHSAGCPLRHVHAFTVRSHGLASVRGRRHMTIDDGRIPPALLSAIAVVEHVGLSAVVGSAAAVSLLQPSSVRVVELLSVTLTLAAFTFLSSFSTAMAVRQQRASTAVAVAVSLVSTTALPVSAVLCGLAGVSGAALYAMAASGWIGGALCWTTLVDVLLEEMERQDATALKCLSFIAALGLHTALNAV